jgi:hypothetical protein
MARIRSTKPMFWKNTCLNRKSLLARLTFLGLKDHADDAGRGNADPEILWGELHSGQPKGVKSKFKAALAELGVYLEQPPSELLAECQQSASRVPADYQQTASRVPADCRQTASRLLAHYRSQLFGYHACHTCGRPHVIFYTVDTCLYYWLPGFSKHQRVNRPSVSAVPAPPIFWNPREDSFDNSVSPHHKLLQEIGDRRKEIGGGEVNEEAVKPPPPPPVVVEKKQTPEGAKEEADLTMTVTAFSFCSSPSFQAKKTAISDLLRIGLTHDYLRAIAGKKEQKTFWQIVRSIEHGKEETVFKPAETKKILCKTCKDEGRILDRANTTVEKTAFKPCPACKSVPSPP